MRGKLVEAAVLVGGYPGVLSLPMSGGALRSGREYRSFERCAVNEYLV